MSKPNARRVSRDPIAAEIAGSPTQEAQQALRAGIEGVLHNDGTKPNVVLLPAALQEAADDRAKDLKSSESFKLDPTDLKFAQACARKASTELFREGGFHDLSGKLAQSRSSLTDIQFDIAMRAERAVRIEDKSCDLGYQHGELAARLAYFDMLFSAVEESERKAERDRRPKDSEDVTKLTATKEIFGGHWITSRSAMRRSLRAGLLPSEYKNGTAFIGASKVRKVRANGTDKGKAVPAATTAVDVTQALPISSAALPRLIEALKAVDVDADMQAAEIVMHAAKALAALASGSYVPAETQVGQVA